MLITLEVISSNGGALGVNRQRRIDERGATIGRCPERSDWVIDRAVKSYVSRLHARVVFEAGHFHVIGVGTNPIAVYEASNVVSNGQLYQLRAGDRFFIEDFEILVAALAEPALEMQQIPDGDPADWNDALESVPEVQAAVPLFDDRAAAQQSSGNVLDLIEPKRGGSEAAVAEHHEDSPEVMIHIEQPAQEPQQQVLERLAASSGANRNDKPVPRRAAPSERSVPVPAAEQVATLEDLLRVLNISATALPASVTDHAGRMILTVIQGLVDLLHSRSMIKYEGGVPGTRIMPLKNNPLKLSPHALGALRTLLGESVPGYLAPEAALAEAIDDLHRHQIVVIKAMRTVFDRLLDSFDPEQLKTQFALHATSGLLGIREKARFHDSYVDFFADMKVNGDKLFKSSFAEAYEQQEIEWKMSAKPDAAARPGSKEE